MAVSNFGSGRLPNPHQHPVIVVITGVFLLLATMTLPGLVTPMLQQAGSIITGFVILWIGVKNDLKLPSIGYTIAGLGGAIILTTVFSLSPSNSVLHIQQFAYVFAVILLLIQFRPQQQMDVLLWATAIITIGDGVYIILRTLQGQIVPRPVPILTAHPNIYSLIALSHLVLTIYRALHTRQPKNRQLLWLWAGLTLVLLLGALSRTGLVALVAGLTVFGWFVVRHHRSYIKLWHLTLIAIFFVLLLGVVFVRGGGFDLSRQISNLTGSGRLPVWRGSLEIFLSHPVTGVGPRNFGPVYNPDAVLFYWSNPHNVPLTIGAEQGLIGLIAGLFFLFILAMGSLAILLKDPQNSSNWLSLSYLVAIFAHNQFENPYWLSISAAIFMLTWLQLSQSSMTAVRRQWKWLIVLLIVAMCVFSGLFASLDPIGQRTLG